MQNPIKSRVIFKELLKTEWGIEEFVTFRWGQEDEDNLPPGDVICESAAVLTPDGRISIYVLDWDPNKKNPKTGGKGYYFLQKTVDYDDEMGQEAIKEMEESDSEYLIAKLKLGMSLTGKQIQMIKEQFKSYVWNYGRKEEGEELKKLLKERE